MKEIRARLSGYRGERSILEDAILKLLDEKNTQLALHQSATRPSLDQACDKPDCPHQQDDADNRGDGRRD